MFGKVSKGLHLLRVTFDEPPVVIPMPRIALNSFILSGAGYSTIFLTLSGSGRTLSGVNAFPRNVTCLLKSGHLLVSALGLPHSMFTGLSLTAAYVH